MTLVRRTYLLMNRAALISIVDDPDFKRHLVMDFSLVLGANLPLGPQTLLLQRIQAPPEGCRLLDITYCLQYAQ